MRLPVASAWAYDFSNLSSSVCHCCCVSSSSRSSSRAKTWFCSTISPARTAADLSVIRVDKTVAPFTLEIEPDASGATYFHAAGALLPEGTDAITVCQELQSKGIEARPYWKPMHMQPVFAKNETIGGETAEMFFRRGICLPSGVALNLNELNYVATSLSAAVRESRLMSA